MYMEILFFLIRQFTISGINVFANMDKTYLMHQCSRCQFNQLMILHFKLHSDDNSKNSRTKRMGNKKMLHIIRHNRL